MVNQLALKEGLAFFFFGVEGGRPSNAVRKGIHSEHKEGFCDLIIKEAHKRMHTATLNLCRIRTCY